MAVQVGPACALELGGVELGGDGAMADRIRPRGGICAAPSCGRGVGADAAADAAWPRARAPTGAGSALRVAASVAASAAATGARWARALASLLSCVGFRSL